MTYTVYALSMHGICIIVVYPMFYVYSMFYSHARILPSTGGVAAVAAAQLWLVGSPVTDV